MFESDRAFIERQLSLDTAFLRDLNIMDYSLLLCIEKRQNQQTRQCTTSEEHKQLPKAQNCLLQVNQSEKSCYGDEYSSSQASTSPRSHHRVTYTPSRRKQTN